MLQHRRNLLGRVTSLLDQRLGWLDRTVYVLKHVANVSIIKHAITLRAYEHTCKYNRPMRNQIDLGIFFFFYRCLYYLQINKRAPFWGVFSMLPIRTEFLSLQAKREQPTESWISRSTKISVNYVEKQNFIFFVYCVWTTIKDGGEKISTRSRQNILTIVTFDNYSFGEKFTKTLWKIFYQRPNIFNTD